MANTAACASMVFEAAREAHGEGAALAPAASSPVIDLIHLSRQTFGDHELERELLSLFERQAAQFAARLDAPIAEGAAVWRVELVHTLKGSARAVGAAEVARMAEIYEEAMRTGAESAPARDNLARAIVTARGVIGELLDRD